MRRLGTTWCVSLDFKSHDSNQYAEMLDLIDNDVWTKLIPEIYSLLNLPSNCMD